MSQRCLRSVLRYLDDSDLKSLLLVPSSNNPSLPSRDMPRLSWEELRRAVAALAEGLEPLAELLVQLPVKKHEVVFHEGSVAEGLYVVVMGSLQIQHGNQRGIVLGPGRTAHSIGAHLNAFCMLSCSVLTSPHMVWSPRPWAPAQRPTIRLFEAAFLPYLPFSLTQSNSFQIPFNSTPLAMTTTPSASLHTNPHPSKVHTKGGGV